MADQQQLKILYNDNVLLLSIDEHTLIKGGKAYQKIQLTKL